MMKAASLLWAGAAEQSELSKIVLTIRQNKTAQLAQNGLNPIISGGSSSDVGAEAEAGSESGRSDYCIWKWKR